MRRIIFVKILLINVTFLCIISVIVDAKRPNFRKDYRFDKAFNAFYKLHQTAVSWYQARIRCEAEGTELIVPETLDEADSMMLVIAPVLNRYEGVFVGIHDLYSEKSFTTIKGHSFDNTILELLWELRQPLHSGGRCVAMRRNGKLFVFPCDKRLPFVCKIKATDINYYADCETYDKRWVMGPNSTCYITHVEQQTWHEAYATCYSAGGHLAILDSREETDHIRNLFKQVDQVKESEDFAFLGYSDLFQRYHYRTVFDKRMVDNEADWDFKCPGNVSKSEDRCGGVSRSGLLTMSACKIPAMFFCEKPGNQTVTTELPTTKKTKLPTTKKIELSTS